MLDCIGIKNLFKKQLEPLKEEIDILKVNQKIIIDLLLSRYFDNLSGTSLIKQQLKQRSEELIRR